MKQITKNIIRSIARPYYWLRGRWFVWFRILNRRGRRLFIAHPPALDAIQQKIAHDLLANGYAVTSIQELFPDSDWLNRLTVHAQALLPHARPKTKKHYSHQLLDLVPSLDPQDPLVWWAINNRVLSIVNTYMGVFSRLNHISLDLTMPVGPDARPEESQRWHRDPEDKVMCKMFFYFTDVTEDAGPLWYVAGSHARGRYRNLFPQRPPRGVYPPQGAVEERVLTDDIRTLTGPRGMIIFCDTSGLHRGGYAKAHQRLAATCAYSSEAGFMLDRLQPASEAAWASEELSLQVRFALTLENH